MAQAFAGTESSYFTERNAVFIKLLFGLLPYCLLKAGIVCLNNVESGGKMTSFEIVRMDWGYALRPRLRVQKRLLLGQIVSYLIGVCCAVAALGTLMLPILFFDGALTSLRVAAAGMFGVVATYLLWFASRGTRSELHIDFETETIRALVPHRGGAPTLLGAYPFSAFKSLMRRPAGYEGQSDLTLQPKAGGPPLWLARAATTEILALQSRLERDLFVRL